MDTLIQRTGYLLYSINFKLRKLLFLYILRSQTSVLIFILITYFFVILPGFFGLGFSFPDSFLFSLEVTFLLFIILFLIGSVSEARRLEKKEMNSSFQFNYGNLNGIHLQELGFCEYDRENLNLLLNNLPPKNKIDFNLVSDNRMAADYKKLFRILHLLIEGGIKDFKKEKKELLFHYMQSNFTLSGKEVNKSSFTTRYSEWINENEQDFQTRLLHFQKILDQRG